MWRRLFTARHLLGSLVYRLSQIKRHYCDNGLRWPRTFSTGGGLVTRNKGALHFFLRVLRLLAKYIVRFTYSVYRRRRSEPPQSHVLSERETVQWSMGFACSCACVRTCMRTATSCLVALRANATRPSALTRLAGEQFSRFVAWHWESGVRGW